jgi:hypothetical protein
MENKQVIYSSMHGWCRFCLIKNDLIFAYRFTENKTEAAGERGWVLVGSQSGRRSMERDVGETCNDIVGGV